MGQHLQIGDEAPYGDAKLMRVEHPVEFGCISLPARCLDQQVVILVTNTRFKALARSSKSG